MFIDLINYLYQNKKRWHKNVDAIFTIFSLPLEKTNILKQVPQKYYIL